MRDAGRLRIAYQPLHGHSWTNIVLWCAVWGFVLVTWLLANLLAELFGLIGIRLLRDLLREGWFAMMLVGGAFAIWLKVQKMRSPRHNRRKARLISSRRI